MNGVATYYDRNTSWFERFGAGSGAAGAIRRGVWAPGVRDTVGAVDHANDLVARSVVAVGGGSLVDLGCGIGGSLRYLVDRHGGEGLGVTISAAQVARARATTRDPRVRFVHADYCDVTTWRPARPVDVAFAIEALVHCPTPGPLLAGLADVVRPGGRLVVVDDFRAESVPPEADGVLAAYRDGWHAHGLATVERWVAAAAPAFGLVQDDDLTPLLRLWRPRDRLIHGLVRAAGPLLARHPYGRSLVGGDALQQALSRGWIRYRHVVLARR